MVKTTTLVLVMLLVMLPFHQGHAQEAPPPQPQLVAECIVFIVVVGGGLYIAYKLKKFCDANLAPANPPPPPATNSPPANPSPPKKSLVTADGTTLQAGESVVDVFDITGHKYLAPDGTEYDRLMVWKLDCSTNLTTWTTLTVTGYISPTFVLLQQGDAVSLQQRTGSWGVAVAEAPCRFFRNQVP